MIAADETLSNKVSKRWAHQKLTEAEYRYQIIDYITFRSLVSAPNVATFTEWFEGLKSLGLSVSTPQLSKNRARLSKPRSSNKLT